ncbi:MAG: 2-oxo acid dehydrogenase subunit E2 [Clostridiaceae bacterium]|jgi:pyruvate dehydrogenase E2 component (dihydrolipoamide acetyltransferase)|nr:2-oxo acid dehydrogenase subunit E2 [Clostridiaceae bacterium]
MATPVIMPRQGNSVESCIITEWFVKKGQEVAEGDVLFSYETDKAAFEEESKVSGTVLELFFEEGDDVPVLTNVCVIGEQGEDITPFVPEGAQIDNTEQQEGANASSDSAENQTVKEIEVPDTIEPQHEQIALKTDGEIFISPRARNLAEKIGADIRYADPTGPNQRIIERDIRKLQQEGLLVTPGAKEAYKNLDQSIKGLGLGGRITTSDLNKSVVAESKPVEVASGVKDEVEYEEVKLSNIRKVIARTMHSSLSEMAQLTLNTSFDATEIINLRKKLKANAEKMGLTNITLNDILLYAVSRVLLMHKAINAHFTGETIRYFSNVHMGVAVDTERGLMVPTLFNANKKSLNDIAIETKELAQACQKGTINPDYLQGGTFTVTNLGALGIESFTPVINPPQTAILGVNTTEQRIREVDGTIQSYTAMSLSLTFDHRAVDGAPAARFLKDLTQALENFNVLLAK